MEDNQHRIVNLEELRVLVLNQLISSSEKEALSICDSVPGLVNPRYVINIVKRFYKGCPELEPGKLKPLISRVLADLDNADFVELYDCLENTYTDYCYWYHEIKYRENAPEDRYYDYSVADSPDYARLQTTDAKERMITLLEHAEAALNRVSQKKKPGRRPENQQRDKEAYEHVKKLKRQKKTRYWQEIARVHDYPSTDAAQKAVKRYEQRIKRLT